MQISVEYYKDQFDTQEVGVDKKRPKWTTVLTS